MTEDKIYIPRSYKDISGQQFGPWKAISPNFRDKRGERQSLRWKCACIMCGEEASLVSAELRRGRYPTCKCSDPMKQNFVGRVFGKLLVLDEEKYLKINEDGREMLHCKCQCDCGNIKYVYKYNLYVGHTKTCGCSLNRKGKNNPNFKGRTKSNGYILIYEPDHPNANGKGFVLEHTLVMSRYINRPLEKGELVHHKNGNREDNRIDNLELWKKYHPPGQRIEDLIVYAKYILEKYKQFDNNKK